MSIIHPEERRAKRSEVFTPSHRIRDLEFLAIYFSTDGFYLRLNGFRFYSVALN